MDVMISLPEDLSAAADALARRLGVSRSELVVAAVRDFVDRHAADDVTARLDRLYASEPAVRYAQRHSLDRER